MIGIDLGNEEMRVVGDRSSRPGEFHAVPDAAHPEQLTTPTAAVHQRGYCLVGYPALRAIESGIELDGPARYPWSSGWAPEELKPATLLVLLRKCRADLLAHGAELGNRVRIGSHANTGSASGLVAHLAQRAGFENHSVVCPTQAFAQHLGGGSSVLDLGSSSFRIAHSEAGTVETTPGGLALANRVVDLLFSIHNRQSPIADAEAPRVRTRLSFIAPRMIRALGDGRSGVDTVTEHRGTPVRLALTSAWLSDRVLELLRPLVATGQSMERLYVVGRLLGVEGVADAVSSAFQCETAIQPHQAPHLMAKCVAEFEPGQQLDTPSYPVGSIHLLVRRPEGLGLERLCDASGTPVEVSKPIRIGDSDRIELVLETSERRHRIASIPVAPVTADSASSREASLKLGLTAQGRVDIAVLGKDSSVRAREHTDLALVGLEQVARDCIGEAERALIAS